MNLALVVAEGMQISLHFTLELTDGNVIDSTRPDSPASFVVGDGSLPAPLEALLIGMEQGQSITHSTKAGLVFGVARSENIIWLARTSFSEDIKLEVGLVVSFEGMVGGGEAPGIIKEFTEEQVLVDFNHPLAEQDFIFKAQIIKIESPQAEHKEG